MDENSLTADSPAAYLKWLEHESNGGCSDTPKWLVLDVATLHKWHNITRCLKNNTSDHFDYICTKHYVE
jgi:hypothetical protein